MQYLADLHLHSRYARATSKDLTLVNLVKWAKIKGLRVIAIPDYTHPKWMKEVEGQIERGEDGFYYLKGDETAGEKKVGLVFCTELSAIFDRGDKKRKIHFLVISPEIGIAKEVGKKLSELGNIESDGRPVFKKDIVLLIRSVFEVSRKAVIIPAHIWTPWYSLFGAKSGFDSFEEAFGEYSDKIPAVETGLSSDPSMNWIVSQLDSKNILSFSDAHSLYTLGRESTIFEGEFSYKGFVGAIKRSPLEKLRAKKSNGLGLLTEIGGTAEFYPELGKYHYTGHRKCGISQPPEETNKYGERCPNCQRNMTLGVLHRVAELADRKKKDLDLGMSFGWVRSKKLKHRPEYIRLVPLNQVIAHCLGIKNARAKTVMERYFELCKVFGSEWEVLTKAPTDGIREVAGKVVAKAIQNNRVGDVGLRPGFDGQYGEVDLGVKQGDYTGKRKPEKRRPGRRQSRLF